MPRYIDADKLRDEVDDTLNWETINEYNMYSDIMDMIDNAPTEDVQPVIRAHWNWTCSCSFRCSNCNNIGHSVNDNYCTHCGAKMDGGKENDN